MFDSLLPLVAGIESEQKQPLVGSSAVQTPNFMRQALFKRFQDKIIYNPDIDRKLVSFQANKQAPFYSWFKYKEGFSAQLVQYLLPKLMPQPGVLLDPFAGSGSALFAARELGWKTQGIEVLPVGIYAMKARMAAECLDAPAFSITVEQILRENFLNHYDSTYALQHIFITRGAFPENEEKQLIGYISYCHRHIKDAHIQQVLIYAAFCILEDISYTRKDGQYLRWDARSNRSQGKKTFNKGTILSFRDAIERKLHQMVDDLTEPPKQGSLLMPENLENTAKKPIEIFSGSCLDILPTLPGSSIDFVLTSPPYANRYDYTRTYALELVYLGCSSEEVKNLRQTMLSCTVENREKKALLEQSYANLGRRSDFQDIESAFQNQSALQEILVILDNYRTAGSLNNSNIARLVRNYFYEMCFVIYELARLIKPGGIVAMVNDNVRYAGEEVPVDIILSDIAEQFGLTTRYIWTLGRGKGNSSQQMGNHGRSELRKCVYVWHKE